MIDFWADWCGPCKQLTPTLEKLAAEFQGRFLLCKIDTESEQELAAHFQIRSIPTIKIIKGGAIVDEFTGVQPENVIREMLNRHCGEGAEGARTTLAQLQIAAGMFDEAKVSLDAVPEEARDDRYQSIAGMFDFANIVKDAPPPPELEQKLAADAGDTKSRYQLSAFQILGNQPEAAAENLLEIVRTDRKFEEDAGRTALIQLFSVIGNDHPLTADYRRKLARLLN